MLKKDIVLTGKNIQLEPLQSSHREVLKMLSQDERITLYSPALKLKFDSWFDKALQSFSEAEQFTFIVRDLKTKAVMGSTRFYEIKLNHKRLTIGYTWYVQERWGSGVNLDCKLLLLNYAFHILKMNRVEFQIDSRNERSRFAVKKLGAIEEGILRQHIILDDDYVRDTVIYSILKDEWPLLSTRLSEKLASIK